jgi:hypothetical protein
LGYIHGVDMMKLAIRIGEGLLIVKNNDGKATSMQGLSKLFTIHESHFTISEDHRESLEEEMSISKSDPVMSLPFLL